MLQVVIAGSLICLISFGLRASMGLFMPDLAALIQSGRTEVSLAIAIQNLSWGVMAPVAGILCDKLGNVKVLLGGALLYALGLALTPLVTEAWQLNITLGLLVGTGVAATAFGVTLPAMARLSRPEKRGTVLGIGTAAGSAGQAILVPISAWLVAEFGGLNALYWLAGVSLLIILLAAPLAQGDAGKGVTESADDFGLKAALKEAAAMPTYWYIVAGFFVCGFQLAFITAHMPSYLVDAGCTPQLAASALAVIGLFNIFGAYYAGVLSNKLPKRWILAAIYALRAVSIVVFISLPPIPSVVYGYAAITGLLWLATIPPTSGLVAYIFGTRHMAVLYGIVFLSHQIGSFTGVWLGGYAYDTTGSYDIIWYLSIGIALFSAVIHIPVKEKPVARLAQA